MHRKTVVIQYCRVTVNGPIYPVLIRRPGPHRRGSRCSSSGFVRRPGPHADGAQPIHSHHPGPSNTISTSPIMHRKTVVIQFCRVTVGGPVVIRRPGPHRRGSRCSPSGFIRRPGPHADGPRGRSHASSNLNFNFTYHASQNCSHPILPGHCWRPSLSSVDRQSSSVGLAGTAESLRPIRSHHPGPSNTA